MRETVVFIPNSWTPLLLYHTYPKIITSTINYLLLGLKTAGVANSVTLIRCRIMLHLIWVNAVCSSLSFQNLWVSMVYYGMSRSIDSDQSVHPCCCIWPHYQELSYYRNCHSGYRYSNLDRFRLIPFDWRPVSVVLPV